MGLTDLLFDKVKRLNNNAKNSLSCCTALHAPSPPHPQPYIFWTTCCYNENYR